MVAAKPTPGTPIESTWGGEVHDAAVAVRGVVCSGPAQAAAQMKQDTIIEGDASMVDLAADYFIAPQDGVYELSTSILATGYTGGAYRASIQSGTTSSQSTISGTSWVGGGGNGTRGFASAKTYLPAGGAMRVLLESGTSGSGTPSYTNTRTEFRLIGQAWSA